MLDRLKTSLQDLAVAGYGAAVRSGVMRLPLARSIFLSLYHQYKLWIESGPIQGLQRYARPGSTVIDVGANVGFFTTKFATWVGEHGRVFAIEPNAENYGSLLDSLRKAGVSNRVTTYHAVAAAESGYVKLQRNELHPGDHRISTGEGGLDVRAVTIDEVVAQNSARDVSLIKIDVQGAEMLVLAGAVRTLSQRPSLFIEVDESALSHFGSSTAALLAHMEHHHYRMHTLSDDLTVQPISREELSADLRSCGYVDVLFLPA